MNYAVLSTKTRKYAGTRQGNFFHGYIDLGPSRADRPIERDLKKILGKSGKSRVKSRPTSRIGIGRV